MLLAAGQSHGRDLALDSSGQRLFVANPDSRSISVIDTAALQKLHEWPIGAEPESLSVDAAGLVWVTLPREDRVVVVGQNGVRLADVRVGDSPFDVIQVSPSAMAVSLFGADEVVFVDRGTFEVLSRVNVLPGPRGLAINSQRDELLVAHFFSGRLSVVDVPSRQVEATIASEHDANLLQNLAISQDGAKAFLPLTRSNTTNPSLTFDTTVFPVVSVIDLGARVALPGERLNLDVVDQPVGIPIDAALVDDRLLFVLHAASNDLSVIDLGSGQRSGRIAVDDNPRSMVLWSGRELLFVSNRLAATVSVIDVRTLSVLQTIVTTSIPLPTSLLNGKRIFNASNRADVARDRWISCATCHFDGSMDGRTWLFPDGPRNTPTLLGSGVTAPYHWSGDLDELHDVEATIRDIQAGTGLADGPDNCTPSCDAGAPNEGRSADLDDLAVFMASLSFDPNPHLDQGGRLGPAAFRGSILFHSVETGCSSCHGPPLYTDRLRHDVGTGGGNGERKGPDFDTPSLRGLHQTAPYLHDGRAQTVADVLTTHNRDDLHGRTSALDQQEITDLAAFLISLTFEPPLFKDGFE